jgi:hypothetical protein
MAKDAVQKGAVLLGFAYYLSFKASGPKLTRERDSDFTVEAHATGGQFQKSYLGLVFTGG